MATLQLHGPALARPDGRAAVALSAREAALLAWLHLEGPTPRSRLAGLLWPDRSEAQARANLRQTLARLKRDAGPLLHEAEGRLALAPGVAVAPAGGAVLLGPLAFDDAPELDAWLQARREADHRALQREHLSGGRAALAAGALDLALAAADALLALQPESEEAWRLRMEALHRRGDRAAALQAWDDCRHALRSAFGVVPSAETQALGRRLLEDDTGPAAPGLPEALRHPPRLVAREALLADAERCLALGHAVLLQGPGGIGKSRVLAELARRAGPALRVGARPGDAVQPGALLARLAEALQAAGQGEGLEPLAAGRPLRSALEHRAALAALAAALQAAQQAGHRLLVVDDLQFADPASLEALQGLIGRWWEAGPGQALLPVVAWRPGEAGPAAQALVGTLLASGRATRLDLAPLDEAGVHALLAAVAPERAGLEALATALHRQLGGRPADLLEALRSLWLDGAGWRPGQALPVPPTLADAVRRRLEALGPEALQLAQLAAVAQADFSLPLAAAATGRTPLALAPLLAELGRAQVFDGRGFAHDLVAEAVQQSLPEPLRAPLHRLVAEHLAARNERPASVAHHLEAAGAPQEAVPWHLAAGRQARCRWQLAAAADAFDHARATADPQRQRALALQAGLEAAHVWLLSDRPGAPAAARAAIEAVAPTVQGPAEQALLDAARLALLHAEGSVAAAAEAARALLPALASAGLAPGDAAHALRRVASFVPYGVDAVRALALAETLLPALAGDRAAHTEALATRGMLHHWLGQARESAADLEAAWALLGDDGDPAQRIVVGNRLLRVRHSLGELDAALAVGDRVLALAERSGVRIGVRADLAHVLGMLRIGRGELAAGRAQLDAACRGLQDEGLPLPDAILASLAVAELRAGRPDAAQAWLDRHPPPGRPDHAMVDLHWLVARAHVARARGEPVTRWTDALAALPADALPPGARLEQRSALAALDALPADALAVLAADLRARGLAGLLGAVQRARGRAGDAAAAAEGAALARHNDLWIDPGSG